MKITSFTKTYDGRVVLDFPGLELQRENIYAVIGANGSGKSTFAKVVSGIITADQKGPFHDSGTIGYMAQKNYAFRMRTKDNIYLNGKDPDRAKRLMEAIHISHLADKPADKLSGGEMARMALVRLMMKQYDLVILDEPTAAMDMETTLLSEKIIQDYVQETSCSMFLVTHSLQQARRIADHVLYFQNGKLLEYGSKETLLYDPKQEETRNFLEFYGI